MTSSRTLLLGAVMLTLVATASSQYSGCDGDSYRCNNSQTNCLPASTWCDGYRHCSDGSDEPAGCNNMCPSTAVGAKFCRPSSTCLFADKICNGHQDCADDSDEVNCTCRSHQYQCTNGRCIYKEWLCDGVADCPLGDDELPSLCNNCSSTEFHCTRGTSCIAAGQECDGFINCNDTSDEANCLSVMDDSTSSLLVKYRGVSDYYVCSDQWTSAFSDAVCQQLQHAAAASTLNISLSGLSRISTLTLISTASPTRNVLQQLQPSQCSSGTVVGVTCMDAVCGRRSPNITNVGPYIIGGHWAVRGAWPWQVMLKLNGHFRCGGMLLNNRWILTAAHCIADDFGTPFRASRLQVRLGGILATDPDPDAVYASVSHVIPHSDYSYSNLHHDIGLLRLTSPVQYTDTILPICLPSPTVNLDQFKVCVVTGFGRTSYSDPPSNRLLQAKMNIIPYDTCLPLLGSISIYLNDTIHICPGSLPSRDIGTCKGDSGSPLACRDQEGTWNAIGINSFGWNYCEQNVMTRVSTYVDWIQQTISRYV